MFEKAIEYETLKYLGGRGSSFAFFELEALVNRGKIKVSQNQFIKILKKQLEYQLLKLDTPSDRPFLYTRPCPRFSLTDKGGKALECYKWMRYHDDGPSLYKLQEEKPNDIKLGVNQRDPREYFDKKSGKWKIDLNRI